MDAWRVDGDVHLGGVDVRRKGGLHLSGIRLDERETPYALPSRSLALLKHNRTSFVYINLDRIPFDELSLKYPECKRVSNVLLNYAL